MANYSLGIDVGTSGIKTGILNLATLKLEHVVQRGYDSSATQESTMIWNQTIEAVKETVNIFEERDNIRGIGLSGQMHGIVLYDSYGSVIGPIINWQDKRCDVPLDRYGGKTTIEIIMERLSSEGFDDLGIDIMASGFFGATLFYLKENDRALFDTIKHAVLPTDFIRDKLLGKNNYATDQTNACSTGLFNIRLNRWYVEFIEKLCLPLSIFPEVHYTSEIAGYLDREVAESIGLRKEIPVIFGGGDNQMSILGSGLVSSDSPILINIGTGAQISKVVSEYRKIPGIDTRSFFNGMYAFVGASLGGGTSYKWLRDEIKKDTEKDIDFLRMDNLASEIIPGSDGLRFCPGPSRKNPNRKIGFHGEIEHIYSIGHRARAVMEGVLIDLYEFYRHFGNDNHNVMMGAGNCLQKSDVWSQITANLFDKTLLITDFENAVFGAALMAASGTGRIEDFGKVINSIEYREITPDQVNSKIYKELVKQATKVRV